MAAFTDLELAYLGSQPLMRFASASLTGQPDVATVVFTIAGDEIVTAGFDISKTVRYKNIQANPRATVVVDDLASVQPWSPRGIKVRGRAQVERDAAGERFRIIPEVIWSWGINNPGPGVPAIERRVVQT